MTYSYEYINNIYDFQDIEIFGIPGKFTNLRVDRKSIPEGKFAYDLRGGDDEDFCSIEHHVVVNHSGTVILDKEIDFKEADFLLLNDNYNFL